LSSLMEPPPLKLEFLRGSPVGTPTTPRGSIIISQSRASPIPFSLENNKSNNNGTNSGAIDSNDSTTNISDSNAVDVSLPLSSPSVSPHYPSPQKIQEQPQSQQQQQEQQVKEQPQEKQQQIQEQQPQEQQLQHQKQQSLPQLPLPQSPLNKERKDSGSSISRLAPDEEKEKLKIQKEQFREQVIGIVKEIKIEHLTLGTIVKLFTKDRVGVQGICRLSKDRKALQFHDYNATQTDLEMMSTPPTERILVNRVASIDPSLSVTVDAQLAAILAENKDANTISLVFKDQVHDPTIVLVVASRNEYASWLDGLGCLMGASNFSTSVQLKSEVELMCEVLALDRLYPPPPPPGPPPEVLEL